MLPKRLHARMARARDLDDSARKLLAALEVDAAEALRASPVRAEQTTTVARSTLVLRDGLSARAVVIHPQPSGREETGALISRSAWTWLQSRLSPCLVDPGVGSVRSVNDLEPRGLVAPLQVSESTVRFLDAQQGTHLLVLPLLDSDSVLRGAVSIALRNLACVGAGFRGLVDWSASWTGTLPAATELLLRHAPVGAESVDADALLPVIGAATRPLFTTLHRVARSRTTVLLQGEPGVGKSRLARWVHAMSSRRDGPFVAAHLHQFTPELLPGALFGWKKGAHSGATADHPGLLGEASNGTLFLDEVDRMPISTQDRLLELLESKVYRPLSGRVQNANVRIIVGTNRDLEQLAAEGQFRRDLLDRIADVAVILPPLRERRDEIAAWSRYMARHAAQDDGFSGTVEWGPGALQRLEAHHWPRNLRGLHRCVRRAWMLAADGSSVDPVVIGLAAVEQALALGFVGYIPPTVAASPGPEATEPSAPPDLQSAILAVAAAWNEANDARPEPLPFHWGEAVGAAIVHGAIRRAGNRAAGLRSLGLGSWVRSGNSKKISDRATRAWTRLLTDLDTLPTDGSSS